MNIKRQDVLVALKMLACGERKATFEQLGKELGLSASEANEAFRRASRVGLIRRADGTPVKAAIAEFLIHGLKFVLSTTPRGRTRGIPTGYAAPPLAQHFNPASDDPDMPVWPDPEGQHAGLEVVPLCRSAPRAALRDPLLYEWLVLADAMRGVGKARERELAESIIRERLNYYEAD